MALVGAARRGTRVLLKQVTSHQQLLPLTFTRHGGGGGPVKMAPPPDKPVPLWEDELWWDDGQVHTQPFVDYVAGDMFMSPGRSFMYLATGMGAIAASYWAVQGAYDPSYRWIERMQYPEDVKDTIKAKGRPVA